MTNLVTEPDFPYSCASCLFRNKRLPETEAAVKMSETNTDRIYI